MLKFCRLIILVICLATSVTPSLHAQKQPQVQEGNLSAPDNIKIDGQLKEWPNPFLNDSHPINYLNAYNSLSRIYYTISNDDNNLYLAIRGLGTRVSVKLLGHGLNFTISPETNKKSRSLNSTNVTIIFPVPQGDPVINRIMAPTRENRQFYNEQEVYSKNYVYRSQLDSLEAESNKRLIVATKDIKIKGITEIPDTLLSVFNEAGIRAAFRFKERQPVIELAIPLKYLNLDIRSPAIPFSYNIKLIGIPEAYSNIEIAKGTYKPTPDQYYVDNTTEIWGEYTLAKKL